MRKIWYIAFFILLIFFLIIGVSAISSISSSGNVNQSDFVGAYIYSSWIVQIGYNGEGIIYDKTDAVSTTDRFSWTNDGNIFTFSGAQNHGAFMQQYMYVNNCFVGANGDITLVPYK